MTTRAISYNIVFVNLVIVLHFSESTNGNKTLLPRSGKTQILVKKLNCLRAMLLKRTRKRCVQVKKRESERKIELRKNE